jgi:hypothetical protein
VSLTTSAVLLRLFTAALFALLLLLLSTLPSPTSKISDSLAQHPKNSQPKYPAQNYRAKLLTVIIIIMIINPYKPYLTASAPRLTHWGGGK